MSYLLLALLGSQALKGATLSPFLLPGKATPRFAIHAENHRVWLIRQEELRLPELWLWDGAQARLVEIPEGVAFIRPMNDGKTLVLLDFKGTLSSWSSERPKDPPKKLGSIPLSFEPQPWQFLAATGGEPLDRFAAIGRQAIVTGLLNGGSLVRQDLPKSARRSPRQHGGNEQEFLVPSIWFGTAELFWMNGSNAFAWDLKGPIRLLEGPKPGKLSSASLLPPVGAFGRIHWLEYGGKAGGELGQVFWRFLDREGKALFQGDRVLVRFGLDPLADRPRLFLFTTTNSKAGQALGSVFGLTFHGTLLSAKENGWTSQPAFQFEMKKESGSNRKDNGIYWNTDLNRDGFADLVVCDAGDGLRYYLSRADGGQATTAIRLGKAPQQLLCLPERLLICNLRQSAWSCEWFGL